MATKRVTVVVEASVANFVTQLLDAKPFVDPIPHVGRVEGGQVKGGLQGTGPVVEGAEVPEGIKDGQRVWYRKEY